MATSYEHLENIASDRSWRDFSKNYTISPPGSDKICITFHRIMEMPQFFSVNMHN